MHLLDLLVTTRYKLESDGSVTVVRSQDVEPILVNNREIREEQTLGAQYKGRYGEGRLVASLPFQLIEKWRLEEGFDVLAPGGCDMERLRRKLNSLDCKDLRLTKGRI